MRIAVIENDQGLQRMVALLLGEEGFEVVSWLSGEGAFAMIVRERPDVVILDLRLEESRTGLAILGEIRADPRTRDTAVILCSGDVQFLREHAAMACAGRCGIIEKPFAIAELLAMIRGFATPPRAAEITLMNTLRDYLASPQPPVSNGEQPETHTEQSPPVENAAPEHHPY